MSYLDNIKALATELANMAPKTQMELIKLCKDLCINTKNYLVAFDETTLPALDARIEALESLTSDLSSELNTAEGNIQANANAIATIQDTITTIQTALSNVYTKSQIDTMFASYYTKSQIDTMFASYYNKTEVDTALSGKRNKPEFIEYYVNNNEYKINNVIKTPTEASEIMFFKTNLEDIYIKVIDSNDTSGIHSLLRYKASYVDDNNYEYIEYSANFANTTYTITFSYESEYDAYYGYNLLQGRLISGQNIKTINNTSLLGSGNINISGGKQLYLHKININYHTSNTNFYVNVNIINDNNTPINSYNTLYSWLDTHNFNDYQNNSYQATGYDSSEGDGTIIIGIATDGTDIYYFGACYSADSISTTGSSGSFEFATFIDTIIAL